MTRDQIMRQISIYKSKNEDIVKKIKMITEDMSKINSLNTVLNNSIGKCENVLANDRNRISKMVADNDSRFYSTFLERITENANLGAKAITTGFDVYKAYRKNQKIETDKKNLSEINSAVTRAKNADECRMKGYTEFDCQKKKYNISSGYLEDEINCNIALYNVNNKSKKISRENVNNAFLESNDNDYKKIDSFLKWNNNKKDRTLDANAIFDTICSDNKISQEDYDYIHITVEDWEKLLENTVIVRPNEVDKDEAKITNCNLNDEQLKILNKYKK